MFVEITGANNMYTTKRYKRAHHCVNNSPNIKVLMKVIETEAFNADFTSR